MDRDVVAIVEEEANGCSELSLGRAELGDALLFLRRHLSAASRALGFRRRAAITRCTSPPGTSGKPCRATPDTVAA